MVKGWGSSTRHRMSSRSKLGGIRSVSISSNCRAFSSTDSCSSPPSSWGCKQHKRRSEEGRPHSVLYKQLYLLLLSDEFHTNMHIPQETSVVTGADLKRLQVAAEDSRLS